MSGDVRSLVRFMCVAKTHSRLGASALTIHQGAWAFCPAGGTASGHAWQAVDALPLGVVMSATAVAQDGGSSDAHSASALQAGGGGGQSAADGGESE